MLRIAFLMLLVGLSMIAPTAHAAANANTCRAYSAAFLEALQNGDYAAATTHFDASMKAHLDAQALGQVWRSLTAKKNLGVYDYAGPPRLMHYGAAVIVNTPLHFTHGRKNLRVACDMSGKIEGVFILPARREVPEPTAATPTPLSVKERPLAVSSPYGPLPGLLTLPAGKGPFPGVVLVAGSGPEDMNESIGPNKPFHDIALGLAANGMALLCYDKRTHLYARQMMSANPHVTIDDVVTDDALTALHELARQKEIDPQRVFLLGHSLGALMAPRIALSDPQVDGVILLAAPATGDLLAVAERQVHYIARVEKWPATKLKAAACTDRRGPQGAGGG
jgi:dienelactone hydrolase